MAALDISVADQTVGTNETGRTIEFIRRNPTVVISASVLIAMFLVAIFAPYLATDPLELAPWDRLKPPGEFGWFGTDHLGRDVYARTIYGARISLSVGLFVALVSTGVGLFIGLLAGYVRLVDIVVLRIMDGFMAISCIFFSIALMALVGICGQNVIIAISAVSYTHLRAHETRHDLV